MTNHCIKHADQAAGMLLNQLPHDALRRIVLHAGRYDIAQCCGVGYGELGPWGNEVGIWGLFELGRARNLAQACHLMSQIARASVKGQVVFSGG